MVEKRLSQNCLSDYACSNHLMIPSIIKMPVTKSTAPRSNKTLADALEARKGKVIQIEKGKGKV